MPLYKKGTCHTPVIVTSEVFVCPDCGQTQVSEGINRRGKKSCPKCGGGMRLVSSQTSPIRPIQKSG